MGSATIYLKFFLSDLKTTKGIERNLFAKKFLSNIFYSPESIKIRFAPLENPFLTGVISRQSDGVALAERSPAPPLAELGERTLSTSKNEFVSSFLAPGAGFEPATNRLTGDCSTAELSRNIKITKNNLSQYSNDSQSCSYLNRRHHT